MHTSARHSIVDYFLGLNLIYKFEQLIHINQRHGSSTTFEVIILHMPMHHHVSLKQC